MTKVAIAVPAYQGVSPATTKTVLELRDLLRARDMFADAFTIDSCALIEKARADMLTEGLQDPETTHLLMLDADVALEEPADVLRMLRIDAPAVFGACRSRHVEKGHAWCFTPKNGEMRLRTITPEVRNGERVIEAARSGLGLALFQRSALERLCAAHPELRFVGDDGREQFGLFQTEIGDVDGVPRFIGEDFAFCRRMRAAGFPLLVAVDVVTSHAGIRGALGELYSAPASKAHG